MKKTIVIASVILLSLLLLIFLLTRPKNQSQTNKTQVVLPTTAASDFRVKKQSDQNDSSQVDNLSDDPSINQTLRVINPFIPYEDDDFKIEYSSDVDKIVITEKTPKAAEKVSQWLQQKEISESINPEAFVLKDTNTNTYVTPTPPIKVLADLFDIFLFTGQGTSQSNTHINTNPTIVPTIRSSNNLKKTTKITKNGGNNSYVYYAQCDSPYASIPMAEGCTVCNTGCGPTTVAMIASSYIDKSYDPKKIIDLYKEKGYLLSCSGTRYADAKAILESLGLKTTDYITYDLEKADKVAEDLKKYYKAGWTFMALANFKDEGPGHFFWITEIDDKNNLWAYDVYYGRFEAPPLNENGRYPFPKYRVIFGVKK